MKIKGMGLAARLLAGAGVGLCAFAGMTPALAADSAAAVGAEADVPRRPLQVKTRSRR